MKVKIIGGIDIHKSLETRINEFILGKDVIDIKVVSHEDVTSYVLIMYEDKEEK